MKKISKYLSIVLLGFLAVGCIQVINQDPGSGGPSVSVPPGVTTLPPDSTYTPPVSTPDHTINESFTVGVNMFHYDGVALTFTGITNKDTNTSAIEIPSTVTFSNSNITLTDQKVEIVGGAALYNYQYGITFASDSSVKIIGDYAFASTTITSITLPDSVTSIGNYAFADSSLVTLTLSKTSKLTSIGAYSFLSSSIEEFFVPSLVNSIHDKAFYYCPQLEKFEVDTDNQYYKHSSDDYSLYLSPSPENQTTQNKNDLATLVQVPMARDNILAAEDQGIFNVHYQTVQILDTALAFVPIKEYRLLDDPSTEIIENDEQTEQTVRFFTKHRNSSNTYDNALYYNSNIDTGDTGGVTDLFFYPIASTATDYEVPNYITGINKSALAGSRNLTALSMDLTSPSLVYQVVNNILYEKTLFGGATNYETLVAAPGGLTGVIEIEDDTTLISAYAFAFTNGIDLTSSNYLTTIDEAAFFYATSLTVNFGTSLLNDINQFAFYHAVSTSSVTPNIRIQTGAFAFSTIDITSSKNLTVADYAFFNGTGTLSLSGTNTYSKYAKLGTTL